MTVLDQAEPIIAACAWNLAPHPRDREDLAQIGRLAAWQATEGFDGTGDPVAWACAKAKWAMIDWLRVHGPRSRHGRLRSCLSLEAFDVDCWADPAPDPETQVCDRAAVAEFAAWLSTLPVRTADAVLDPPSVWAERYGRHPTRASQVRGEALKARAA